MRLRHVPGSEQMIAESPYVIQTPSDYKGSFCSKVFGKEKPVHIEVGMGKGRFIMELAARHPDICYIGIERYPTVLLQALKKMEENPLPNLKFLCVDAKELGDVFAGGEVGRIYLNFSDPWPKDRHARRRLTSVEFMNVYDSILERDGVVEFKTDNQILFQSSLQTVPEAGWEITEKTFDLHNSQMAKDNVMTEYEIKFSGKGNPICKLIARRS